MLSVSSWGNVNLIWNKTMHGWGFYSARSLRLHKKVLSSLWNTCLVGLNIKMEIISFPVVRQNPDKPVFFPLHVRATLGWSLGKRSLATCSRSAWILTVHTRGSVPGSSSHLAGQTGALDCLWPLLNAILITASVSSDYFTCPPFW